MTRKVKKYYDSEEKELFDSLKDINLKNISPVSSKRQKELIKTAKDYKLNSDTHLHIRINSDELNLIKETAKIEGLKYSSFVKSILHKYITGQFQERKMIW